MPVTKTAKRALRSSKRKQKVNKLVISGLDAAIRVAKKTHNRDKVLKAISLADRAAKKKVIHKNKAARIKSSLGKYLSKPKSPPKKAPQKTKAKAKK